MWISTGVCIYTVCKGGGIGLCGEHLQDTGTLYIFDQIPKLQNCFTSPKQKPRRGEVLKTDKLLPPRPFASRHIGLESISYLVHERSPFFWSYSAEISASWQHRAGLRPAQHHRPAAVWRGPGMEVTEKILAKIFRFCQLSSHIRLFFARFSVPDPRVFWSPGSGSTKELWIRIRLRIRILLSSCKNNKKNLKSYNFVALFDFLSLKHNVNAHSKSNKQKKLG